MMYRDLIRELYVLHYADREHAKIYPADWPQDSYDLLRWERGERRQVCLKYRPNTFTEEQWEKAKARFCNKCAVCGASPSEKNKLVKDHWIPITSHSSPGTTADNIIPLCAKCNREKKDRHPRFWLVNKFGAAWGLQTYVRICDYLTSVAERNV